jgi:prepilin-type N-terminal cleavage/methylation domain-containing protein
MRLLNSRRPAGFTLVELIAALAVIAIAVGMLVAALGSARRLARGQEEAALARAVARGVYERLRGAALAELPGAEARPVPAPPEAAALEGARLTAACSDWPGERGLRGLRVEVVWKSRAGQVRRAACEGLISDARER